MKCDRCNEEMDYNEHGVNLEDGSTIYWICTNPDCGLYLEEIQKVEVAKAEAEAMDYYEKYD